jgi:hypothetical protein
MAHFSGQEPDSWIIKPPQYEKQDCHFERLQRIPSTLFFLNYSQTALIELLMESC